MLFANVWQMLLKKAAIIDIINVLSEKHFTDKLSMGR